jgi:putative peptidoglycan lipid II flippase
VLPTVVGYLAFGLPIVGAVYRRGAFGTEDQRLVYLILAAYTLGLAATTVSRLLQNSYYAAGDTATPAKIAVLRVGSSVAVAVPAMLALDHLHIHQVWGVAAPIEGAEALRLGAVGLALGSAVGAWIELTALRRGLGRRLPGVHLPVKAALRLLALAVAAAPAGAAAWWLLAGRSLLLVTPAVVAAYAVAYLGAARLLGFPELTAWTGRLHRRG